MAHDVTPVGGSSGYKQSDTDRAEAGVLKQTIKQGNYDGAARLLKLKIGFIENSFDINGETPIVNALMDPSYSRTDVAKVLIAFKNMDEKKTIIPLISAMEDINQDRTNAIMGKLESLDADLYNSVYYDLARYDIRTENVKVALKFAKASMTAHKAAEIIIKACAGKEPIALSTFGDALYLLEGAPATRSKGLSILEQVGRKDPGLRRTLQDLIDKNYIEHGPKKAF